MKKRICIISLITVAILVIGFSIFKFLPIGAKQASTTDIPEIENDNAKLKDMAEGTETVIKLSEIVEEVGEAIRLQIFKNIAEIM